MVATSLSNPSQTVRLSLILLLNLCCAAFSLVRAELLPVKTYTTADGLAHNEINKIVRDSRGFLWFCTADGLSRFDGYTFTNFGTDQGLPHANVTDLLETRSGEYWLATYGGVVRFNPKGVPANRVVYAGESIAIAPMFTVVVPEDQDRHARAITVLLEDRNGTIWCGTQKGLSRLERNNDRLALRSFDIGFPNDYPEQRAISDLLEDQHGSLWIAAPSGLYRRWPDGRTAHYTKQDGLPNEYLQDLLEDHERNLWVTTRLGGFFRLVTDATRAPPVVANTYTRRDGLPADWVFQLFETANRRFWVATSRGLVEFFPNGDDQGRRFRSYTERNGLSYHDITALNEDLGGNLWLGTNVTGAMKLARQGFVTYDVQDGIDEINAVFQDRRGAVCVRGWVLGDGYRSVFEGAKLDVLHSEVGQHVPRFGRFDGQAFKWLLPRALTKISLGWVGEGITLQDHHGEWWIGTGAGLYRFPAAADLSEISTALPVGVYNTKNGLGNAQVFRLFEDSRGNVWVSTIGPVNSLALWERASGSLHDLSNAPALPPPRDDIARCFGEDRDGNVWIGFSTGLARYHDGNFTFLAANEGLPSGGIQQIHLDHAGRLWLASTRGGLIRMDDPQAEQPHFVSVTTSQGLSSNLTSVIIEDHNGNIYVGTGRGLDVLNPGTGRIRHFTTADGLVSGSLNAAFEDTAGTLWFGAAKGLSRFSPAAEESPAAPPALITRLSVSGASQMISALGETEVSLPEFAASQNQMQIDFVGLSFVPGEVLRYQYKLEGADADWGALSEQRRVNYANLAPGRYRFLVRAANSDGVSSAVPASVTFKILRPVWQRWWFLTLAGIVLALLIYAFYRYRIARMREMAGMRTRIATDLHDDIGANLTRISLLSEVAKQSIDGANGHEDSPLMSISRIARESVGSMSDIVWAIDPERDSLLDLIRKMRQHADEVFTLRDIELQFNAPGATESLRLGVDVRRDLLLIFKEAVNNAARHSHCKQVTIDLQLRASRLSLEIADNGMGFDQSIESEGHGLRSMRRRAAVLGGTLEINSSPGAKTIIRVDIPIARARRVK